MLPQEFRGKVVSGDGRGRQIGFPTANIDVADQQLSAMKCGVYDARVSRLGEEFVAIANLGRRPTFDGEQLRFKPPVKTVLGDLRAVSIDYSYREMVFDVGQTPVHIHARHLVAGHPQLNVDYGPIHLAIHEEAVTLRVRGGAARVR